LPLLAMTLKILSQKAKVVNHQSKPFNPKV